MRQLVVINKDSTSSPTSAANAQWVHTNAITHCAYTKDITGTTTIGLVGKERAWDQPSTRKSFKSHWRQLPWSRTVGLTACLQSPLPGESGDLVRSQGRETPLY